MKGYFIYSLLMVLFVLGGCSSPPPSGRFLTATLALPPTGGIEKTEPLHMRVVDLYNLFDLHVTKKWKRVHENSWKIIIDGNEPSSRQTTRMVITLAVAPNSDSTVIIRSITEGGKEYPPDSIAEMIRQLDKQFIPKKQ